MNDNLFRWIPTSPNLSVEHTHGSTPPTPPLVLLRGDMLIVKRAGSGCSVTAMDKVADGNTPQGYNTTPLNKRIVTSILWFSSSWVVISTRRSHSIKRPTNRPLSRCDLPSNILYSSENSYILSCGSDCMRKWLTEVGIRMFMVRRKRKRREKWCLFIFLL